MSYCGNEDNYILTRLEAATTVSEVLDVLQQWYIWGNYDGTGAQILTKLGDIGQGDLAAIAALSKSSMGNIVKTRCAAQNALSNLAKKGDVLASEALDKSLAYWQQKS
ncbi:hypothetical protein [Microcoleus sp. B4-C1]|uniref:hypothetical protein n=1 Tax=Microcoleus sp. B4-C1 TaxID=2818660 RepID=UPI002FD5889A